MSRWWSVVPVLLAACREPTQITLEITTDVACGELAATTVAVGSLGDLESRTPAATTTACQDGRVGSLVAVPADNGASEVAFRVVSAAGGAIDACSPPDYGGHCIVARRALGYVPHAALVVPIAMSTSCRGILCATDETCVTGTCVPARIALERCEETQVCDLAAGSCDCGSCPIACSGDANADGVVDFDDINVLLASFGAECGEPGYVASADFDQSGVIDSLDRAFVVGFFGCSCDDLCACERTPPDCPGDANADGTVDALDLGAVQSRLDVACGDQGFLPTADTNLDGTIDTADVEAVQDAFGSPCP